MNISECSLPELKYQDQALVHHLDMVAWFLPSFSVFQKTTKPADFLYKPEYQPATDSTTNYLFNAIL